MLRSDPSASSEPVREYLSSRGTVLPLESQFGVNKAASYVKLIQEDYVLVLWHKHLHSYADMPFRKHSHHSHEMHCLE